MQGIRRHAARDAGSVRGQLAKLNASELLCKVQGTAVTRSRAWEPRRTAGGAGTQPGQAAATSRCERCRRQWPRGPACPRPLFYCYLQCLLAAKNKLQLQGSMSSKLLKSQLHSVIRQRIDKQEGSSSHKGKQPGKRAAKRAKKQPPTEEQQAQTLAANLKYFARTTTARGTAADLVTEVRRRTPPLPPPPPPQVPALPCCVASKAGPPQVTGTKRLLASAPSRSCRR